MVCVLFILQIIPYVRIGYTFILIFQHIIILSVKQNIARVMLFSLVYDIWSYIENTILVHDNHKK